MPFLRQGFPVILFTDISQKKIFFSYIYFFYILKSFGKYPINTIITEKAGFLQEHWKNCKKFWHRMKNDILF